MYVGKTTKGIIQRWLNQGTAHWRTVTKILKAKNTHQRFEDMYEECKSALLADCYLAWAILSGSHTDTALFVVECCENDQVLHTVEATRIDLHDTVNTQHGLNRRNGKNKPNPSKSFLFSYIFFPLSTGLLRAIKSTD